MKVILLSVLATLALGSLSGISVSHKDNGKLTENRLNAKIDLDNDPYCEYSSVVYNVDLDKENYFTGHGNPDWYRIEDEVYVTDVLSEDYRSVEYLSIINNTNTTFSNSEIEFSTVSGSFYVTLVSYSPFTQGQVVIYYRFHSSQKFENSDPDSDEYYIDDSINELPPIYCITDDAGDNDKFWFSKKVYETGCIKGTINTYNPWIAFWNGSEIDEDWYVFSIKYKLRYTFTFTAPNSFYKFSFYPHKDLGKSPSFTLKGVNINTSKSKTITIYPGTYFMRVTATDKSMITSDKYSIDYKSAKPANDKLFLTPSIMQTNRMAVWNNDILSDRIPNKFQRSSYELATEAQTYAPGYNSGHVDPILSNEAVLDSLLVIWDKDICNMIYSIMDNLEQINYVETLKSQNNEYVELGFETFDNVLQFVVIKGGEVLFHLTKATVDMLGDITMIKALAECAIKILCCFFRPEFTPEELAFMFGTFWGLLKSAAYYTGKPGNDGWAMYIPIYGKLSSRYTYEGPDPTPDNPRPSRISVKHYYWERSLFEPNMAYSLCPGVLDYPKRAISQYQTIQKANDSTNKRTFHGTIEALSDPNEVLTYLYNGFKNL